MELSAYINYFKNLAKRHILLRYSPEHLSFFALSPEEVDLATRSKIQLPALFLMMPTYEYQFQNDALTQTPMCGYMIIDRAGPNDFERKEKVWTETLAIGKDIYHQMIQDRIDTLYGFKPETMNIVEIGPINSRFYGWMFEFELQNCETYVYNPNRWISDEQLV